MFTPSASICSDLGAVAHAGNASHNPRSKSSNNQSTVVYPDGQSALVNVKQLCFIRQNGGHPGVLISGEALLLKSASIPDFEANNKSHTLSEGGEVTLHVQDSSANLAVTYPGMRDGQQVSHTYALDTESFMQTSHPEHSGAFKDFVQQYVRHGVIQDFVQQSITASAQRQKANILIPVGDLTITQCNERVELLARRISGTTHAIDAKPNISTGMAELGIRGAVLLATRTSAIQGIPSDALTSTFAHSNPLNNAAVQAHKKSKPTNLHQSIKKLDAVLGRLPSGQLSNAALEYCLNILAPHNLNDREILTMRRRLDQLATTDQKTEIQKKLEALRLEAKQRNLLVSYILPDGQSIEFPPPPNWPSTFNTDSRRYHHYSTTTDVIKNISREALQKALEAAPTPGLSSSNPATPYGTLNDIVPSELNFLLESPVISYVMDDGVVVNVTQPEHPFWPGYVARTIVEVDSGYVVRTYGEGLGWLQSPVSPISTQRFIDRLWNRAVDPIRENNDLREKVRDKS